MINTDIHLVGKSKCKQMWKFWPNFLTVKIPFFYDFPKIYASLCINQMIFIFTFDSWLCAFWYFFIVTIQTPYIRRAFNIYFFFFSISLSFQYSTVLCNEQCALCLNVLHEHLCWCADCSAPKKATWCCTSAGAVGQWCSAPGATTEYGEVQPLRNHIRPYGETG